MKRLLLVSLLMFPSLAMAQQSSMISLPATLIQKMFVLMGYAPYKDVQPVVDELNATLHPPAPAQTSGMNYPDGKDNRQPGPHGGPGQPPVTPPPPSIDDHADKPN